MAHSLSPAHRWHALGTQLSSLAHVWHAPGAEGWQLLCTGLAHACTRYVHKWNTYTWHTRPAHAWHAAGAAAHAWHTPLALTCHSSRHTLHAELVVMSSQWEQHVRLRCAGCALLREKTTRQAPGGALVPGGGREGVLGRARAAAGPDAAHGRVWQDPAHAGRRHRQAARCSRASRWPAWAVVHDSEGASRSYPAQLGRVVQRPLLRGAAQAVPADNCFQEEIAMRGGTAQTCWEAALCCPKVASWAFFQGEPEESAPPAGGDDGTLFVVDATWDAVPPEARRSRGVRAQRLRTEYRDLRVQARAAHVITLDCASNLDGDGAVPRPYSWHLARSTLAERAEHHLFGLLPPVCGPRCFGIVSLAGYSCSWLQEPALVGESCLWLHGLSLVGESLQVFGWSLGAPHTWHAVGTHMAWRAHAYRGACLTHAWQTPVAFLAQCTPGS